MASKRNHCFKGLCELKRKISDTTLKIYFNGRKTTFWGTVFLYGSTCEGYLVCVDCLLGSKRLLRLWIQWGLLSDCLGILWILNISTRV